MGSELSYADLNFALVKNVGDARVVITYNSSHFIVEPGDIEPVAFEAVCVACGDPRSSTEPQVIKVQGGESRYIPARIDERKRLRNYYGILDGGEDFIDTELPRVPRLEVKYRGHRVYTVLEDPYGYKTQPEEGVSPLQRSMQEQMAHLEDQLAVLKTKYDNGATPPHEDYVTYHEDELPQDSAPDPGVPPLPRVPREELDWATAQTTQPFDE